MSVSYYSANLADFAGQSRIEILGDLTRNHRHDLEHQQRNAWPTQIDVLKEQLAPFPDGQFHFEFIIPRMGKRADCILLINSVVFVLEFKINSAGFDRYAIDQAHDYALEGMTAPKVAWRSAIFCLMDNNHSQAETRVSERLWANMRLLI